MSAHMTLGNFGFAKHECFSQYVGINKAKELKCQTGTISELVYYGLIPDKPNMKSRIHGHDLDPDFCGDPKEFNPQDDCSSCLDSSFL